MLNDLPPWEIVYQQAHRWLRGGCFEIPTEDLRIVLRGAARHTEQPSAPIIDSRTLRFTPESGERITYDGAKRKKGSKLHLAVDTLASLLALHITPTDTDDRAKVGRITEAILTETGVSVEVAFVVQGYVGEKAADAAAHHGIERKPSSCRKPNLGSCCCAEGGSPNEFSPR